MVESLAAKLNNISVEDIDAEDKENPLLCSEYINGIYDYMRVMEVQYQVINYTDNSYSIHSPISTNLANSTDIWEEIWEE